MAYIDYTFYTDEFHGNQISQSDFSRLSEIASDMIDGIVAIPVDPLNETSFSKVKKACAYIAESLDANGGVDAINGTSAATADSESLGDYSVSTGSAAAQHSGVWFGDMKIPTLAYSLLKAAGLMSRWLYKGTVIDDGY